MVGWERQRLTMVHLNEKFRTQEEIDEIKKHYSPPKDYPSFLTTDEIKWLITTHDSMDKQLMTDAYRNSIDQNHSLFDDLSLWARERFYPLLSDFKVSYMFFYESPTPLSATDSTVHTDIWYDESVIDKTILIPLQVEPDEPTYTILFDQHYYHYGAAYAGRTGNKQHFGATVILPKNYDKIENFKPDVIFSEKFYFNHLTHKPYSNFYGLTVADHFKWHPTTPIIFNRTQLHCCDHYFKINKRKWFSIWTNRSRYGN